MSTAKLLTTLRQPTYLFVEKESKRQGKSKSWIVEKALEYYMKKKKKAVLQRQYQFMSEDTEYLDEQRQTADFGLEYFLDDFDEKGSDKKI